MIKFAKMIRCYSVAGHRFSISAPDSFDWNSLSNYAVFSSEESSDVLFSMELTDELPPVEKTLLYTSQENPDETRLDIYTCDGGYYLDVAPSSRYPVSGCLLLDSSFSRILIKVLDKRKERFLIDNAAMLIYAFATSTLGTLLMHSSVVVSDGKAYMFLAPSGTGKSTHSRMWLQNIPGTTLLNDDNPVISFENGIVMCYGTPWSGKTPCYKNESAPVGAIVNIKREKSNFAQRLNVLYAYASLLGSSSGLKSDPVMGEGLHKTMEKVVSSVPFFNMNCLPDPDAAVVCCAAVKGAEVCASTATRFELPNDVLLPEVDRLLSEGHDVELMAKGCSMLPFIVGNRDSVRLRKKTSYSKGDIVLSQVSKGRYVLHRIISSGDGPDVVLMGDGNLKGVEKCRVSDICGAVTHIVKPGRMVVPGKAVLWRLLLPFRRYLLFIYRHLLLSSK